MSEEEIKTSPAEIEPAPPCAAPPCAAPPCATPPCATPPETLLKDALGLLGQKNKSGEYCEEYAGAIDDINRALRRLHTRRRYLEEKAR